MTVKDVMDEIREVKRSVKDLFDMKNISSDQDVCDVFSRAMEQLCDYQEMLENIKTQE